MQNDLNVKQFSLDIDLENNMPGFGIPPKRIFYKLISQPTTELRSTWAHPKAGTLFGGAWFHCIKRPSVMFVSQGLVLDFRY